MKALRTQKAKAEKEKEESSIKGSAGSAKSVEEGMMQWPELCPRCWHKMVETHCKIFCPSCGYMRDCNDQW